jgi:hypothetical protein
MNRFKNVLKAWLPFAVTISAFCFLVYAAVQQSYRQSADDPQVQMANDAADALAEGHSAEALVPAIKVSMEKSLAPFLIIYDSNGHELASSALLDGQTPALPNGVLDSTKQLGENRISWQPRAGVRIATVIVSYKDGFVLAGRNMREVEQREAQVSMFASMTWILATLGTLAVIIFGELFLTDKMSL